MLDQNFAKYTTRLKQCPGCKSTSISPFYDTKNDEDTVRRDKDIFDLMDSSFSPAVYDFCDDCGLLFLNPRWNDEALGLLYGDQDIFRKSARNLFFSRQKNVEKLGQTFKGQGELSDDEKYYRFVGLKRGEKDNTISPAHFRNGQWLKKHLPGSWDSSEVYDVGAGFGVAQRALEKAGFKYVGYEPSQLCSEHAQSWGRNVTKVPFQNLPQQIHGKAKLLYTNHFLEHVEEPVECLKLFNNCLEEGGLIFTSVPTANYLSSNLPSLFKAPHYAKTVICWRHMSHFDDVSLTNMMSLAGFEVLAWENFDESILMLARKNSSKRPQLIKPSKFKGHMNVHVLPAVAFPVYRAVTVPALKTKHHLMTLAKKTLQKTGMLKHVQKIRGTV